MDAARSQRLAAIDYVSSEVKKSKRTRDFVGDVADRNCEEPIANNGSDKSNKPEIKSLQCNKRARFQMEFTRICKGFTVLKIAQPAINCTDLEASRSFHQLFIRRAGEKNDISKRTLVLLNVPIGANSYYLRRWLRNICPTSRILNVELYEPRCKKELALSEENDFDIPADVETSKGFRFGDDFDSLLYPDSKEKQTKKQRSLCEKAKLYDHYAKYKIASAGSRAHITFLELVDFEKTFKKLCNEKNLIWNWPKNNEKSEPVGSEKYILLQQSKYPSEDSLQQCVDSYMLLYTEHEKKLKLKSQRKLSEPDDDGFVTVTRSAPDPVRTLTLEDVRQESNKKQKEACIYPDFYRWQFRSNKRKVYEELQRKAQFGKMKFTRRTGERSFKPF